MRKVHIALVGGQPAPVYYGIQGDNPDIVELVYSDQTEKMAKNIMSAIPDMNFVQSEPLDPIDPVKIRARAGSLLEKYSQDEVTFNITGGAKAWSHLFAVTFTRHPNCRFILVDQNNNLWDYRVDEALPVVRIGIKEHLALYGNPLDSYSTLSQYTKEDREAAEAIERIRNFSPDHFRELLAVLDKKKERELRSRSKTSGIFTLEGTLSFVKWWKNLPGGKQRVQIQLENPAARGKTDSIDVVSPNAISLAFNSGWFEFKVADILSRWHKAEEIFLNCHFKTKDTGSKDDKNEVDVIVKAQNRILFVECKTGLSKITDIDKFKNVVKTYGGTACHGIFITYEPVNTTALEKCRDSKLLQPFSINMKLGIPTEEALYMLLDEAIQQINVI